MTVQPIETDTHIDIAALVGELEAVPCESVDHSSRAYGFVHDRGFATHYARVHCPLCGWGNVVKAYCSTFVGVLRNDWNVECGGCEAVLPAREIVTILGPVNS